MRVELKSCPICGGRGKLYIGPRGYHVECAGCGLTAMPVPHAAEAAARWNRRIQARGLARRIEHAVYDYVVRAYGESEAYDPSWSTPDLARAVARDIVNPSYRPENRIKYSWEDEK